VPIATPDIRNAAPGRGVHRGEAGIGLDHARRPLRSITERQAKLPVSKRA